MIGIILAGGKSLRLPHKILLPQREIKYRPIIASSIDCTLFCDLTYIFVNKTEEKFLYEFLNNLHLLRNNIRFLIDNYNGIVSAISIIAKKHPKELLFILCGDNVYNFNEINDKIKKYEEQAVIKSCNLEEAKNLSIYDSSIKKYIRHSTVEHQILLCQKLFYYEILISPWILRAKRFLKENILNQYIEDILTKWQIPATLLNTKFWYDIGTFESYEKYITKKS